jgi:lipopolysaccharide cholinephosphotransferase
MDTDAATIDGRLRRAQMKMLAMLEVVDAICLKHGLDYWLDAGTLLGAIRHQGFIPWDDDMDIAMPRDSYEAFLQIAPSEIPEHMWLQTAQTDPGFYNVATPLKIRDRRSRYIEKHEQINENYVQGIFIDVFVYDTMPVKPRVRQCYKFISKKISRILKTQYSLVLSGHNTGIYKMLGRCIPKPLLEKCLAQIIKNANSSNSPYLGRGYQCVGKNLINKEDIYPLKRTLFETGLFNVCHRPETILSQQYGDFMSLPPEEQRIMRHCKELIPDLE